MKHKDGRTGQYVTEEEAATDPDRYYEESSRLPRLPEDARVRRVRVVSATGEGNAVVTLLSGERTDGQALLRASYLPLEGVADGEELVIAVWRRRGKG